MVPNHCRWKAIQSVLLAMLLSPVAGGAAEKSDSAEPACRSVNVQPEDVDFDQPQAQIQKRLEYSVPEDARIGEIRVQRRDIFDENDPEESGWFYSTGNAFHVVTRESAIRAQLLFEPGEPFDASRLAETERALRGRNYLLDAWVQPWRICGNRVDVVVVTRDLWTLRPDIGFARAGGESQTSFGITDGNFLGYGKRVKVKQTSGPERSSELFDYFDPNVLGSRWRGSFRLVNSSDGQTRAFDIGRPFFKFGTEWATRFSAREELRVDKHFFQGEEISEFQRDLEEYEASGGLSLGIRDRTDYRVLFGFRHRRDVFETVPGEPAPDPFPSDRTLSYPWIGLEVFENRFVETVNLTRIQRIEDVQDGIRFDTRIGWSDIAYGGSADRLVFENRLSDTAVATQGHFVDYELEQTGWYNTETEEAENLQLDLKWRYFLGGFFENQSWFASVDLGYVKNQTADRQFALGGENGLRGYPLRHQLGDRRYLVTVERRYYADWHPFELFRVGGVAFFDIGRAWYGDGPDEENEGSVRDVGIGLRISSDRFETGSILHIDLAYPLDGGDDIDDMQVLVRGKSTF